MLNWIPTAIGLATSLLAPKPKVKRSLGQQVGEEAANRILGIDTKTDWQGDINKYYDAALRIATDTFKKTIAIRDAQYTASVGGNPYLAGADTNSALQNASFGQALIAPNELARAGEMLKIPERRASILSAASQAGTAADSMENNRRNQQRELQAQSNAMWGNIAQTVGGMFVGGGGATGARSTTSPVGYSTNSWGSQVGMMTQDDLIRRAQMATAAGRFHYA